MAGIGRDSRLNETQRTDLRTRYLNGEPRSNLASVFGVSTRTVSRLVADLPKQHPDRATAGLDPSTFMDRVWAKVDRRGDDECWPWTGYCHPDGHGMYGDSNYVHRLIYEETHSTKPPVVRHSCDNPPCCNPRHLLGGTQADNMKDMADRGRSIKGRQLKTRKVKT